MSRAGNMGHTICEVMHMDRKVAEMGENGRCRIFFKSFLPYNLFLEEEDDIDTLVNNVTNFNYWCATRVLTLDRTYAKEILNSIGVLQAVTDRERAKIALSYRCASLTDVYWVRYKGERVKFDEINLYDNHLSNTFMDIALRGRQYTVQNEYLARDLSTNGCFPKAWQRSDHRFRLLKDGGEDAVNREILASRICRCFDVDQVSIASAEAFNIYVLNHDRDLKKCILSLDSHNYYMMNIMDYLTGNTSCEASQADGF